MSEANGLTKRESLMLEILKSLIEADSKRLWGHRSAYELSCDASRMTDRVLDS